MSGIFGHERQIQYLEKVLKNGRLAHAYLFYGPEHVGKFTIAKYIAEKTPCSNPVILSVESTLTSKKEKRKDIPIEDIRELKRLFSLAPAAGQWKVAVINEAEKMSPAASDAFLKLLEEPGAQTLFILVSHDKELLPPTIISRTVPIRFSTLSDELLSKFAEIEVKDEGIRREMVFLAAGRPGLLWRYIREPDFFQREKGIAREIKELFRSGSIPLALEISEKVSYNEKERLRVIEQVLRQYRSNLTPEMVPALKKINTIVNLLSTTNVNPRLALDVLLLQTLENV